MMLLCKLAAAVLVAAVLTLLLKKDQPAFAFLVSVCTAAGLLAIVVRQVQPLLDWLHTLDGYFQGQSPAVLLQVLGIALVAQLAADTCKERSGFRGGCRHRALRQGAGAVAGAAAAAIAARLVCGLFAVVLLLAVPPPVFADELSGELPKSVRDILDEGGTDLSDAARWHFSDLCDTVGAWAAEGLQPALHLAAQSAGYLLLAGLLGLLAGDPYRAYVEILAVLGFGTLSLSAAMQLTELVAATAQDCRTYLTAFVPVFSGLAAAGGQTSGALVYSGMFFAMSGFLSAIIQKLLLPVMQLYFCFAVSACLWDNPGMGDAAALFSRCLHWLLKGCGALFSLVLGLQSVLAATADSAALRTGKGVLQGVIPVVGDAAAAALTGAAAAVQLLKGSLALAALLAQAALFAPVLLQCLACALAFAAAGILAGATGQRQCAQLCRLYFEGHDSAGPCWCCISS